LPLPFFVKYPDWEEMKRKKKKKEEESLRERKQQECAKVRSEDELRQHTITRVFSDSPSVVDIVATAVFFIVPCLRSCRKTTATKSKKKKTHSCQQKKPTPFQVSAKEGEGSDPSRLLMRMVLFFFFFFLNQDLICYFQFIFLLFVSTTASHSNMCMF
jgi:hypothetical protein